jgi:cytochrome c-type biogenesis protein CcmH
MRLFVLPASMALTVLLAAGGYAWLAPADPSHDVPAQAVGFEAKTPAVERAPEVPVEAAGWQVLGHAHAAQGRHAQAVVAYRNAARLQSDDAALLTDYAFSAAVTSQRGSVDEPQRLVERALQIDPNSTKALALAGTLALDRNDYDAATQYWERLAQLEPHDSPTERAIQASIAQTRRLASAQAGRIELARR